MRYQFALVVALVGAVVAAPAFAETTMIDEKGLPCDFYDSMKPQAWWPCPEGEEAILWEHDADVGLPPLDEEEAHSGSEPVPFFQTVEWPDEPMGSPVEAGDLSPFWFGLAIALALLVSAWRARD